MDKLKELTEEIQKLENDYAEILACGGDAGILNYIWRQIKDLRSQLAQLSEKSSPGEDAPPNIN